MTDSDGHRHILDRPRADSPPGAWDISIGNKKADVGTVWNWVRGIVGATTLAIVFYFTAVTRPDQLDDAKAEARTHADAIAAASAKADERLEARSAAVERTVKRHSDAISRVSGKLDLLVDLEMERANREGPKARQAVREAVRNNPGAGVALPEIEPED